MQLIFVSVHYANCCCEIAVEPVVQFVDALVHT